MSTLKIDLFRRGKDVVIQSITADCFFRLKEFLEAEKITFTHRPTVVSRSGANEGLPQTVLFPNAKHEDILAAIKRFKETPIGQELASEGQI